jgi:hypothetical protein
LIAAFGACYDDPSYDSTSFKCDTTHPCPPSQTCANGTCKGPDGVKCGSAGVCGTGMQCCAAGTAPTCISIATGCPGQAAQCDGPYDCPGMSCCQTSATAMCMAASCLPVVCTSMSDCAVATPTCMFTAGVPWGTCN